LRVGVIGCGSIGKIHIENLKRLPGVTVAAACDIDEGELKLVRERFGVEHLYTDYRDLIAREDLDAVIVATPNNLHSRMTIEALRSGKHVMCEKPPAITAREVKEMFDESRRSGRALLIGLTNRFRDNTRVLKEYVEKIGIGHPYFAKTGILRRYGIPGYGSWFTRRGEAGAGPLFDIGVHALDLTLYLMGNFNASTVVASTYAVLGPLGKGLGTWGKPEPGGPFEVEDLALAYIRMRDGATVYLEVSWAAHVRETGLYSLVLGDKAGVLFPEAIVFTEENGIPTDKQLMFSREDPYIVEMRHFKDVVEGRAEPLTRAEEMINLQAILEAALRSAEGGGKPVSVAEVLA